MDRYMAWKTVHDLEGWGCSQCEWRLPVPPLLASPEARSAYNRLASAQFQQHHCTNHAKTTGRREREPFIESARELVKRGFKPKDAVDIILAEIKLESRADPNTLEKARADADEFLRRIREGLI